MTNTGSGRTVPPTSGAWLIAGQRESPGFSPGRKRVHSVRQLSPVAGPPTPPKLLFSPPPNRLSGMRHHGTTVRERHSSRPPRERRENRFVGRLCGLAVDSSKIQHGIELYQRATEPQAVALPPRSVGGRCFGHVHARHALPLGWVASQEAPTSAALTASRLAIKSALMGGHRRSKPTTLIVGT